MLGACMCVFMCVCALCALCVCVCVCVCVSFVSFVSFVCVCGGVWGGSPNRIGVGISANGMMVGPSAFLTNAVICSPGAGLATQQFELVNASFSGIVPAPSPGTTKLFCGQSSGVTVMQWSRGLDNGSPGDAQVSTTGPTWVVWAVGGDDTLNSSTPVPSMGAVPVVLVPASYPNSVALNSDFTLQWGLVGDLLHFQATYDGNAWCVPRAHGAWVCVPVLVVGCLLAPTCGGAPPSPPPPPPPLLPLPLPGALPLLHCPQTLAARALPLHLRPAPPPLVVG